MDTQVEQCRCRVCQVEVVDGWSQGDSAALGNAAIAGVSARAAVDGIDGGSTRGGDDTGNQWLGIGVKKEHAGSYGILSSTKKEIIESSDGESKKRTRFGG